MTASRRVQIVIVNAYHRHNAGDAALLSALIAQSRVAVPNAAISYAGCEDPDEFVEFEGVRNLGSARRWVGEQQVSRVVRIARKVVVLSLTFIPVPMLRILARWSGASKLEPLRELQAIARADVVLGIGGGYLQGERSVAGSLNVLLLSVPLLLASRLRRPILLAPQSYGPFATPLQRILVRHVLNRVDHIEAREDLSFDLLVALGIRADKLTRGVDAAFFLAETSGRPTPVMAQGAADTSVLPRTAPRRDPGSGRGARVGVTARRWLADEQQTAYEHSLADFIDWLQVTRGARVTLVPQVTADGFTVGSHTSAGVRDLDDDRRVNLRIAASCRTTPLLVSERIDHCGLRKLYAGLDYLVGTRFHSVIFSLAAHTPAVAIEYEHKSSGIMRELGLAQWVVPIQDVSSERLQALYARLETSTDEYRATLSKVIPQYQKRAGEFCGLIRTAVSEGG